MSRWAVAIGALGLVAGLAITQGSASAAVQDSSSPFGLPPPFKPPAEVPAEKKAETATEKAELPPEEDKSDAPKEFSFNPVESKAQVAKGDFYFTKGNYMAAISRYEEATKWNDGNAEAWLRLGEAQEKKSNAKAARTAYEKYLELSPDAKNAGDIKKRLAKLKS